MPAGHVPAAIEAGFADVHHDVGEDVTQQEFAVPIDDLAGDESVSGILLQLPLPGGLDRVALIDRISPPRTWTD